MYNIKLHISVLQFNIGTNEIYMQIKHIILTAYKYEVKYI